ALNEENKEEKAIEFYKLLSSFDYMSSTPTLFNSGTLHSQLSSCYLTTVPDDLYGIYGAMRDNAMLSKWAGGLGNDWTPVRGMGAHIKGTNGRSQGVVPFLKVVNDTAVAVNQGGKRKGAVCAYLETWHLDIEEFLELRKNTGDDRRRTHDMNTANWIPDLFMERVMNKESWTLFSPNEAKDLHDLTGNEFKEQYEKYEEEAKKGNIKAYKEVDAEELWRKIISMLFETGHPWLTFKDACNLRSPQQHTGVIHSSNLCTEITLNTSQDEIAVCNLGSVNLKNHLDKDNNLDKEKLQKTISTAIRMLDNVIDINYYAVPQAENSNFKHRPIGLGIMGFQDILQIKKIPYSSDEAVELADDSMETVSYFAIEASSDLAEERGSYSSYEGSLWSQGIFPIDSISILKEHRTEGFLDQNEEKKMDWDTLKEKVKKQGIRNSNVMAIAPTATIANITGVTQSIEPTYSNLFVKSNLSGEFTVINENLVNALKEIDMWDEVMVYDLKNLNGSLETISRVPDEIKRIFATSFEIEPKWLIESASRRQKWIDQSQSLNLYVAEPNGKKLDVMYKMAWLRGLKTTYYLRSKGATTSEKSTISNSELNKVQAAVAVNNPSTIDDEECEACQ
ncbi:ribonucleoside-diphosphate reductase subunit alpha, partial [SAR86 cluster bacterium]|nr:ribonucleoside-diphosphate reductase subunit alpha [SAR86 cluster bacterium]